MTRKAKVLLVSALVLVVFGALAGVGFAVGGDDGEPAIRGSALETASAAALEYTGGGRVTGTEVGDEESYYEVEVTRDDGSQVDVQLDASFTVVGSEDEGAGDDESTAGDDD